MDDYPGDGSEMTGPGIGNEKRGISAELNSAAVYRTFIPMYGFVESLNISVACAISLFASTLSGSRGERRLAPLDIESRAELRSEWIKKSTKRADVILKEMSRRGESPSEDITSLGNISLEELGEDLLASGRKSGDKLRGITEGD